MRAAANDARVAPTQCTGAAATCTPATTCSAGSSASACPADEDGSIYARAWRFVQRRLHLRPRASSCPADMESRAVTAEEEDTATTSSDTKAAVRSSYCADWQRVYVLKELEEAGARAQWRRQQQQYQARQECIKETAEWAPTDVRVQPAFRTHAQRKTAQLTCYNCGLLFFRPLSVASDTSAFCGRDCQSTFEYRRDLQDAVNECGTFRSTVNWTRSSEL
ncbi:hypothetical protein PHYPSEUDO_011844 [Phytophthora pseudosyringae]|uniref:Uncharacterized protein n=1 Tax=Phytophthora pseudosyringae TaxID=221518 RepID=A0A8T1V8I7_9STRA|nr:hypothetical protein PHYPSEUDO_011844 [Phytophthora pseudosyringae]